MQYTLTKIGMAALLVSSLAACSSAPKPVVDLGMSTAAVRNAETLGAAKHAPALLAQAKTKNNKAATALHRELLLSAKHLSEQSAVDAELAIAKTSAVQAQEQLDQLKSGGSVKTSN